jgi:tryptophan synthase alpha chain
VSRIADVFQNLRTRGEAALIGYVSGGDPEPKWTPLIAEALIRGGVDILEIGIPFSDPIADGPTIQAASVRALKAGTTPSMVLGIAREIKKKLNVPIVILTYYNPVFRMGLETFFRLAKNCGVDGVVVADLPVEEAEGYKRIAEKHGVDTIFLAAPSTSVQRLRRIVECTSGFLYLVSHFGVTGEKDSIEASTIQMLKKVLPYTSGRVPIAVGFGISKPEHVRLIVENGADGIIVGSAFVSIIDRHQGNMAKALKGLEETARKLKEASKRSPSEP